MKDSAVKGFNDCFATGGYLWLLFLGLDDWIGSAGEIRFEFRSEFKNSKLFSVTIHDRNEYARSMDDCISADAYISACLWQDISSYIMPNNIGSQNSTTKD
jgi:hypothetical protein